MYTVAILEPAGGKTAQLIRNQLLKREGGPSVVMTCSDQGAYVAGEFDLFVVAPGAGAAGLSVDWEVACRVLLVPEGLSGEMLSRIRSRWAVSYGLSGKDSITVSSLEQDFAVLALQREVVTLDERLIEQQEIPIRFPCRSGGERIMAVYGALLILGVPPEQLS